MAALYLTVALAVLARRKPGYSHIGHTLSELGAAGAPDEKTVRWGVFLPVGILAGATGALLCVESVPAAALGFSIAFGYVVTAGVPSDAGPPVVGSVRHGIHYLAVAARYLGGGAALMAIETHAQLFRFAAIVPLAAVFALMLAPQSRLRGLTQRAAEAALFGGLIVAGMPLP